MAAHKCECFEAVAVGLIDYNSKPYKIVKKAGGSMDIAVQEAIEDASDDAIENGKASLKKATCDSPCKRFRFVIPSVWKAEAVFSRKGKDFTVHVTGQWTAYIVCYDPARQHGEDDDKPSTGEGSEKKHEKSGDGDPPKKSGGKPKAPRKTRASGKTRD